MLFLRLSSSLVRRTCNHAGISFGSGDLKAGAPRQPYRPTRAGGSGTEGTALTACKLFFSSHANFTQTKSPHAQSFRATFRRRSPPFPRSRSLVSQCPRLGDQPYLTKRFLLEPHDGHVGLAAVSQAGLKCGTTPPRHVCLDTPPWTAQGQRHTSTSMLPL